MTDVAGQVLIVTGAGLLAFAGYGVIVLPDALARQHAATKAGTLAIALICFGALLVAGEAGWTLRLLTIVVFLLVTLPVASHMLARAAVQERGDSRALREAPLIGESEPEDSPER